MAAARNAGPPIVGGNASIESSEVFIAALFGGAGGGDAAGIERGGREPVGSAAFGGDDCDAGGVGMAVGAALGAALGGGASMGCAAGAAVAAGSPGEFRLRPALAAGATAGATAGITFGAVLGIGAAIGVGAIVSADDGSTLPAGCGDLL